MSNPETKSKPTTLSESPAGEGLGASPVRLSISDVKWEYEDELPEMEDSDYDAIFPASKVVGNEWGGVRMFPYVEDDDGNRIWISRLPNIQVTNPTPEKN